MKNYIFTKETYAIYLRSDHWKNKRSEYLANDKKVVANRKKFGKDVCVSCKSPDRLNIHHKTYERVKREELKDLMLLCRKCHLRVHDSHKGNKKKPLYQHTYKILHDNWKNSEEGKLILNKRRKGRRATIHGYTNYGSEAMASPDCNREDL